MRITLSTQSILKTTSDLLVVGAHSIKVADDPRLMALDGALGAGALEGYFKAEGFEAKRGQLVRFPAGDAMKAGWVLIVGLGKESNPTADARRLALAAARASKRQKSAALSLPLGAKPTSDDVLGAVRAGAEGLVLGAYRYTELKTGARVPKGGLTSAAILVEGTKSAAVKRALAQGVALGESVNVARDLVNGPPNLINPITLAQTCVEKSAEVGLSCKVWNKKRIAKERMNLLLAVNAGSDLEPRFIHMVHRPKKAAKKKVVFVGKGLTFDSGGLCIKPAGSMIDMKCDMAGAAATLGIVLAAARLDLPVEVHGVITSTENMTGGSAYRPGDVYTSREGKTVEVINTDAEGRLALADALSWAKELEPDYLIDHATLTGACMVGLGPYTAGLFAQDEDLVARYLEAGEGEGESFWRLPLNRDLRKQLDSDVADLKHTGNRFGGSITAALFLKEFVGDANWMHLDIAGPAYLDRPHGRSPKGGTGFGVATAIRFLEGL